jgi:hypothetical protein
LQVPALLLEAPHTGGQFDMDKLHQLKETVDAIGKDSSKFFEKGNKAAGTRARKNLQELKKLAQELRVAIQDTKAGMVSSGAGEHASGGDDDHGVGLNAYDD